MTYHHDTKDPNLNDLHKAMEYRDDLPHLRVTLGADNITITGSVNVATEVKINNTDSQSIPVHLTDDPIGVTQSTTPWVISKNTTANGSDNPINVQFTNSTIGVTGSFWQATQPVSIATMPTTPVTIASMPTTPVTGTFWQTTQPVSGTVTVQDGGGTITVDGTVTANVTFPTTQQVSGTVALDTATLTALENIGVTGTFWQATQPVSIATMPTTPVTGTFWQATQPVSIASLPEIEIKNDTGNPVPVTGNVTATITDVITVLVNEDAGDKYSFNNHAANATRGWTMDNTMRPVVSFQNGSTDAADIIKILEYEIGNNNANQSTIVYEWYEGPLTIAGAAIPAWTTFGQHSQYRVYQDQYSSNQGNTFTVPAGTYMRHSGIIIGKNTSGDEGPANLRGGESRNMLTLCMRRVDNATKLDVWFAFTVKELT